MKSLRSKNTKISPSVISSRINNSMIRTSSHFLNYNTHIKNSNLDRLFVDFKDDLELYIRDIITRKLPLKLNLSSKQLPIYSIAHSHYRQILYKQASEIVRSNQSYIKKKVYKRYKHLYAKCKEKNIHPAFTNKRFSELKIDYLKRIRINLKTISINLDSRRWNSEITAGHFNEFVLIGLPYFKTKRCNEEIKVPIKWHKQSLKFIDWKRKNTIQLKRDNKGRYYINFFYEKEEPTYKTTGDSLGIDLGVKKMLACSNGKYYGKEIEQLYNMIANKLRGSKNYKQSLIHRTNEINHVINTFFKENDIKEIVMEDLKDLRKNSKLNHTELNRQQYFIYKRILAKFENRCKENGVLFTKVRSNHTSQTCSKCGHVDKSSRNGESFICSSCGNSMDADYNASINILHRGTYSSSTNKTILMD